MKQTINKYQFERAFKEVRPDNFTYEGLNALYEYFEGYEEDTGEEIELDVIAICCEYTEYKNLKDLQYNYYNIKSFEDLEENTQLIIINETSFIIKDF